MSEQATSFWTRRAPELRQTLRVAVATAAAFVAYKLLDLQQGYWAIFTVLIVMQGSIGGTLGAATERMIGTLLGAILGGVATAFHDGTSFNLGIWLVVVTSLGVWGAAVRPQFKVAPVTAAIMLLSAPPGVSVHTFVLDRIIEIALGGAIGVLATVFIFPARSRGVVITRSVAVLQRIQNLLLSEAGAIERGEALPPSNEHPNLREALTSVEQAMKDADRERASRLATHAIPPSIPRTLWRIRNDLVHVGSVLNKPLPEAIISSLAPAAANLLRAEAAFVGHCATGLNDGTAVTRDNVSAVYLAFTEAFDKLRQAGITRTLDFDAAGRVFGLAFTLERLHRDLGDLADRINEIAEGKSEQTAPL
jgi:hypothetical protein